MAEQLTLERARQIQAERSANALTLEKAKEIQAQRLNTQLDDTVSRLGIPRTLGGEQALGTVASGIVAEPIAGIAGIAQAVNPYAEPGAGAQAVDDVREALTLKPDNEQAVENLQKTGEALQPVGEVLESANKFTGDVGYELGGPTGGAIGAAIPTLILEAIGLSSIRKLRAGTKLIDKQGQPSTALRKQLDKNGLVFENLTPEAKASIPNVADKNLIPGKSEVVNNAEIAIIEQIKSGGRDDALAGFKVVNNRLEPDRIALEATRQGFTDGFVQAVKSANPETKSGMKRMLSMMQRIKKNERLALDFRPSDVVGDSFTKRITFIRDKANTARLELDGIANNQLRGKQLNPEPIVNSLTEALNKLDVNLVDNGTGIPEASFKGSLISKDRTSQRVINDLIDLMSEGGQPDALRFHKLKRQLDMMIDFRKKSVSGLTDAGKKVLKDIRFSLNDSLRTMSPDYARVNDTLSSSLTALDDFQRVSGSSIDIFGQGANKAIGQDMRGLMSNRKSRVKLENAIDQVNDVTSELGGVFNDDLKDLALFANGLDNRFGAVAKTSFKGEIQSGVNQVMNQGVRSSAVQKATEKAGKVSEKLRGVNDFNAFESMNKLINR